MSKLLIVLLAAACFGSTLASPLAGDKQLPDEYEKLNEWLEDNVESREELTRNVAEARALYDQFKDELSAGERAAIELFVELDSTIQDSCGARSVDILRKNVHDSHLDLEAPGSSKVHRAIHRYALEHAAKCDIVYEEQKKALVEEFGWKNVAFLADLVKTLHKTATVAAVSDLEAKVPGSDEFAAYLSAFEQMKTDELAKGIVRFWKISLEDLQSGLSLVDEQDESLKSIGNLVAKSFALCAKSLTTFGELTKLIEFDSTTLATTDARLKAGRDVYFIVKTCQTYVRRNQVQVTEEAERALERVA